MTGSQDDPALPGWRIPPDTIFHWHLDSEAATAVEDWFGGWVPKGARLDGGRSVLLPLSSGRWLKIKGAGHNGGQVDFAGKRRTGPKMLHVDFDGRVSEDIASGHDNALPGGASYQQAVVEWHVVNRLARLGEAVLPCIGYGRIARDGIVSWFSVFEWSADYVLDQGPSAVNPELYVARAEGAGKVGLRLAVSYGLIGFPWVMFDGRGGMLIKDLHPYRQADPVNMSRVSFGMYLFHALHIIASDLRIKASKARPGLLPKDIHLSAFRTALPDIRREDHEDAITRVLIPYMLRPEAGFRPETLYGVLRSNRLTNRLLDLVPPEYADYDRTRPGQSWSASSGL